MPAWVDGGWRMGGVHGCFGGWRGGVGGWVEGVLRVGEVGGCMQSFHG